MHALLTGAGVVGSEVARVLCGERVPVTLLLRGGAEELAAKANWLRQWVGAAGAGRLRFVSGDIDREDLGLSGLERDELARSVTHVLHVAATTSFRASWQRLERTNVSGTRHVLAFARELPHLQHVGHLSTLYVAGKRTGSVREQPLDAAGVEFDNDYERSKALAEAEVLASELPVSVFRLAIVLGRRRGGQIPRMNDAGYTVMRLMRDGLVGMFPSEADQRVDMIPLDFAGLALSRLLLAPGRPRAIYHVAAGVERSPTIAQFLASVSGAIAAFDPAWARRGIPVPLAVPRVVFERYVSTIDLIANPLLRNALQQVETLTRPLCAPKLFERTHFESALGSEALELTPAAEWLPAVVQHALEIGFRGDGPPRGPRKASP